MAANGFSRLLSNKCRGTILQTTRRWLSSGTNSSGFRSKINSKSPFVLMASGLFASYVSYRYFNSNRQMAMPNLLPVVHAASKLPDSQPSVYSLHKEHALYLWIHLSPSADPKQCAKVAANLQKHVDFVSPPTSRDEDNEILAGVGFGQDFFAKVSGGRGALKKYPYRERKGPLGDMPSTGGDIFIHAKSNSVSKLFELCQRITSQLPPGSISKHEDIYSFIYKNGRDLTGFIDGTENPADEDERQTVAVEPGTGGSYVITQKWIHKLDVIDKEEESNLEGFVGRTREDSIELTDKPVSSHVARMTGGTGLNQKKPFEIVRQSMPYGNLHDKAGLFFIAYAASPENFDYMLDRMVGLDKDGHSDDVMKLSECVSGNYWYFPGAAQLTRLSS